MLLFFVWSKWQGQEVQCINLASTGDMGRLGHLQNLYTFILYFCCQSGVLQVIIMWFNVLYVYCGKGKKSNNLLHEQKCPMNFLHKNQWYFCLPYHKKTCLFLLSVWFIFGSICCMMHGTHLCQCCFLFVFVHLKVDRTCRLAMVKTTYKLTIIHVTIVGYQHLIMRL